MTAATNSYPVLVADAHYEAGAAKVGSEFVANNPLQADTRRAPSIAVLNTGGFAVTWSRYRGNEVSVGARYFSPEGVGSEWEYTINYRYGGTQEAPSITALTNGNYVVAWQSVGYGDPSGKGITAQILTASGVRVGGEFLVNTQTQSSQQTPSIAGLAGGGFVVTWEDTSQTYGDGWDSSVKAQIFTASGVKVGGEFRVNTENRRAQKKPDVTGLADGGFVVTWQDASGTLGVADWSIEGQVYSATGVKLGGEFRVNTQNTSDQDNPTITSLANGGFVVSWEDDKYTFGDENQGSIKAQIFSADGTKVGDEILISYRKNVDFGAPSIAGLSDGGFVVTWYDLANGIGTDGYSGIGGQIYSEAGEPIGNVFRVNSPTPYNRVTPTVAGLPNGGFIVAWQDDSVDISAGIDNGIMAQIFTAAGQLVGGAPYVTLIEAGVDSAGVATSVSNLTVYDPDGDAVTYDTAGWTAIDATHLAKGGTYGTAVLDTVANTITYTLDDTDADTQALQAGQTVVDTIVVSVHDTAGATTTTGATFTIEGANDAPTVDGLLGLTTQGTSLAVLDLLQGTHDPEGDTLTATVTGWTAVDPTGNSSGSGLPDGFALDGHALTIDPGASTFAALAAAEARSYAITYQISDGHGGSSVQTASITVRGTNDAPTVDAPIVTSVVLSPGVPWRTDLLIGAHDIDHGDALTVADLQWSVDGSGQDVTGITWQNHEGFLTLDPSAPIFASLAPGETKTVVATYRIQDPTGAIVPQTTTITVTGASHPPVFVASADDTGLGSYGPAVRASIAVAGGDADGGSAAPNHSAYTGKLAFWSAADNLVAGDTNHAADVFVRAGATGALTLVSKAADGSLGNGASVNPTLSADGGTLVYESDASNLVSGDTNAVRDIFAIDATGKTTRISTGASGTQANGSSGNAEISDGGNTVAFRSAATNLVAGDTNGVADVFVKTLSTGAIVRASTAADGSQANGSSGKARLSFDGSKVLFSSDATNLVAGDDDGVADLFVKDLATGTVTLIAKDNGVGTAAISSDGTKVAYSTYDAVAGGFELYVADVATGVRTLISRTAAGAATEGASFAPTFNVDGTRLAFASTATDLIQGDTAGAGIFVADLTTGTITRVAATAVDGTEVVSFSWDGASLAFSSDGASLVPGDGNGAVDVFIAPFDVTVVSKTSASITDDGSKTARSAAGRVLFADPDLIDTHGVVVTAAAGDLGTPSAKVTVDTDTGTTGVIDWTYDVVNTDAVAALAAGETKVDTFVLTVDDGHGGNASQTVSITLTGANDAPVVENALTAAADGGSAKFTLNLLTGASDADHGATLHAAGLNWTVDGIAVAGAPAGVTVQGDTVWIDPTASIFASLVVGSKKTVAVSYSVVDEFGATTAQSATVTITGVAPPPVVTKVYDSNNKLVEAVVTGISGRSYDATDTTYGPTGKPVRQTATSNGELVYTKDYNSAGVLIHALYTELYGTASETWYNAAGKPTKTIAANGTTTLYTYDAANLLIETVQSDITGQKWDTLDTVYGANGKATRQTATANGDLIYVKDFNAAGAMIHAVYTALAGAASEVWYNDAGKPTKTIAANGTTTLSTYDAANLLTETVQTGITGQKWDTLDTIYGANGKATRQTATANGDLIYVKDFNAAGAMIHAVYTALAGAASEVWYNDAGKPTKTIAANGVTTLSTYDAANLLTETVQTGITGQKWDTLDKLYGANGKVTRQTATSNGELVYAKDFNATGGTIHAVYTPLYGTASETWYNDAGKPTKTIAANGVTTVYTYDAANLLTEAVQTGIANAKWDAIDTLYGANGKVTRQTATSNGELIYAKDFNAAGGTIHVVYTALYGTASETWLNDAGKPTKTVAANGATKTWSYDADGSSTMVQVDPTSATVASSTVVYDAAAKPVAQFDDRRNGSEVTTLARDHVTFERGATSETLTFGSDSFVFTPLATETLTANGKGDTLIFDKGFGTVTLNGFDTTAKAGADHDTVRFAAELFATWSDLLGHAQTSGTSTVITDAYGDKLTLTNTTKSSLVAADFGFGTQV